MTMIPHNITVDETALISATAHVGIPTLTTIVGANITALNHDLLTLLAPGQGVHALDSEAHAVSLDVLNIQSALLSDGIPVAVFGAHPASAETVAFVGLSNDVHALLMEPGLL